MQLLIFVSIQPLKLRSFIYLIEPLPNKQYCLITRFWGKDYLQINAFLASSGRVKKNLKALQMKTTANFGGGVIEEIPSSIKSISGKPPCRTVPRRIANWTP